MRKVIFVLLSVPVVLFWNCSSAPDNVIENIPEWYLNPPQTEDAFHGVGDAVKMSKSLAKQSAKARAWNEVAIAIEVIVINRLKNFMQESGVGDNAEALEFTESVSEQVVSQALESCTIIKRAVIPEGDSYHAYALARYELNSLVKINLDAVRKKKALYNEAKANLSFEDLEKEIQKLGDVGQ